MDRQTDRDTERKNQNEPSINSTAVLHHEYSRFWLCNNQGGRFTPEPEQPTIIH